MNIYIMRHGETEWNTIKRIQGTTDIKLNQNGIKMAQDTSLGMYKEGITFDKVYTSPLDRAKNTATIMAQYSNLKKEDFVIDKRISEFNFGEGEGHTLEEIKANPLYKNLSYWFTEPAKYIADHGAETVESFFGRLKDFIENELVKQEGKYNNVLVSCHGGITRGLITCLLNKGFENMAEIKIPNCSVNKVTLNNGIFTVEYIAKTFYN